MAPPDRVINCLANLSVMELFSFLLLAVQESVNQLYQFN
jgi:hypothetical protein